MVMIDGDLHAPIESNRLDAWGSPMKVGWLRLRGNRENNTPLN